MESKIDDVVVIGAGLAGLRSALLLEKKGYEVTVLEGRDRVGGRTTGTEHMKYQWDLGGQWIGSTHKRMYSLLDELGMTHFPQNIKGKKAFLKANGSASFYDGMIPATSWLGLLDLQMVLWKFTYYVNRMPMDKSIDIWDHPQAKELDSISLRSWCDQHMWTQDGKNLINQSVRALLTVESSEVSLLYYIHFIRSASTQGKADGFDLLIQTEGGAQQDRIRGGSYTVSQSLAKKLKNKVCLNQPVSIVEQKEDHVVVITETGLTIKAKYALFACAPLLTSKIIFEPPLPTGRSEVASRMPLGKVIKCLIFYKENFWTKKGLSGEFICEKGVVNMAFDATLPDGSSPSLCAFICGTSAIYWSERTPEERKKAITTLFAKFIGDEALHPIHYMDMDWSPERFSLGGYTSVAPCGLMSAVGKELRLPTGRIHFAGTETAREWTGYMEGALESAERVSEELDLRLQGKSVPIPPKPQWKEIEIRPWNSIIQSVKLVLFVVLITFFYRSFCC